MCGGRLSVGASFDMGGVNGPARRVCTGVFGGGSILSCNIISLVHISSEDDEKDSH